MAGLLNALCLSKPHSRSFRSIFFAVFDASHKTLAASFHMSRWSALSSGVLLTPTLTMRLLPSAIGMTTATVLSAPEPREQHKADNSNAEQKAHKDTEPKRIWTTLSVHFLTVAVAAGHVAVSGFLASVLWLQPVAQPSAITAMRNRIVFMVFPPLWRRY